MAAKTVLFYSIVAVFFSVTMITQEPLDKILHEHVP